MPSVSLLAPIEAARSSRSVRIDSRLMTPTTIIDDSTIRDAR